MKWLYNPPEILKSTFPKYQWNSKTNKVLFTFDDGPVPGLTESILKKLSDKKIKAVFFCVGNNINNNIELTKEIIDDGHELANHTYNHTKLNSISKDEMIVEIEKCNQVMENKLSYKPKYFRPPHGRVKISLANTLSKYGMTNIMWSLITYDYKGDLNTVKNAAERYLQSDSIVLLHDNIKSKSIINDAIQVIVENCEMKNFEIGTPEECLK